MLSIRRSLFITAVFLKSFILVIKSPEMQGGMGLILFQLANICVELFSPLI